MMEDEIYLIDDCGGDELRYGKTGPPKVLMDA